MGTARHFVSILVLSGAAWPAPAGCPVPPAPAAATPEPLDLQAGEWWQNPAPDIVVNATATNCAPGRAGVPAALVWQFRPTASPFLTLSFSLRLAGPRDRVTWAASPTAHLRRGG